MKSQCELCGATADLVEYRYIHHGQHKTRTQCRIELPCLFRAQEVKTKIGEKIGRTNGQPAS